MRFVAAVQEREKDGDKKVEQVSRELWRRIWSQDKDITESASLSEVPTYAAHKRLIAFETGDFSHKAAPFGLLLSHYFFSQAAVKAGLPASEIEELLKLSTSKQIKDKLKSTTQEALDHGVSQILFSLYNNWCQSFHEWEYILRCCSQNLFSCVFPRHSASP